MNFGLKYTHTVNVFAQKWRHSYQNGSLSIYVITFHMLGTKNIIRESEFGIIIKKIFFKISRSKTIFKNL